MSDPSGTVTYDPETTALQRVNPETGNKEYVGEGITFAEPLEVRGTPRGGGSHEHRTKHHTVSDEKAKDPEKPAATAEHPSAPGNVPARKTEGTINRGPRTLDLSGFFLGVEPKGSIGEVIEMGGKAAFPQSPAEFAASAGLPILGKVAGKILGKALGPIRKLGQRVLGAAGGKLFGKVESLATREVPKLAHVAEEIARPAEGAAASEVAKEGATVGPKLLPAPKMIRHHIFKVFRGNSPRSQVYREFFKKHGIDIDKYTVEISEASHSRIHQAGNNWTTLWKTWIDQHPNASTKEVYQFAGELMDRFGISHLPLVPYR